MQMFEIRIRIFKVLVLIFIENVLINTGNIDLEKKKSRAPNRIKMHFSSVNDEKFKCESKCNLDLY